MLTKIDRLLATRAPKQLLFRHIRKLIPGDRVALARIEYAYRGAQRACVKRMREDGSKAIGHGRAVCLIGVVCVGIKDPVRIIAMLNHDVVEDIKGWTHELAEQVYGKEVAHYLKWLSKPPQSLFKSKKERDEFYCQTFAGAPKKVLECKLCDVLHNLYTLFACSKAKQRRIVGVARRFYLPLAERHGILAGEIAAAVKRVEASWAVKM